MTFAIWRELLSPGSGRTDYARHPKIHPMNLKPLEVEPHIPFLFGGQNKTYADSSG
jgi:hypothetical protein